MPATTGSAAEGPEPSRPPWWMFVLAAAFAGYFALLVHSDLTRPEPAGFVFEIHDRAMIARSVAPESPAARAGLEVGDRILTANGHPVQNRLDWLSIETNLQPGAPLRFEVARNGGHRDVGLPLARASRSFWTSTPGATLLVLRGMQLITLLLAFVVGCTRPFDRSARMGAWILATLAVYSIVLPDQIAVTWRAMPVIVGLAFWIPFACSLAIAALIFTFFAVFPRPLVRSRGTWVAIWAPMAAVLLPQLQFAARVVYRPEGASGFFDWTTMNAAVTAAYTIAALAVLILGYRRLTDLTERRRVRVLVLGSVIGLVSILPVVSAYWAREGAALGDSVFLSPVVGLGATLGLAMPVSFAYAILRHRLFDIAFMVRRGLQYALARRVLVSIVPGAAAIFLADLWLHRQVPFEEIVRARGWGYVGLAGFAVLARLRRNDWLDALDRRFFRERHSAERVLRRIGDDVRGAASLEGVAARVVEQVETALHPELAAILLRHPDEPLYRAVATAPAIADVEPVASTSKTVRLLEWSQKPLQISAAAQAGLLRQLPREEIDWLRRSRVELLVPIRLGNDGVGRARSRLRSPEIGASVGEAKAATIRRSFREGGSADGATAAGSAITEALIMLGPKRSEEPYSVADEDLLMAIADGLASLLERNAPSPRKPDWFEDCPECGACYDFGTGRCSQDGSLLTVTSAPRLLGGRYRLERRVGRGGMGTVYATLDTALQRRVAVKLLREDFAGGHGAVERFGAEARLAAGLAHPNVVTVHDIGITDAGRAFFVMELLEGVTLREELQRVGRMAPPRALHILRAVSAAVDVAHARGMIHRDLKPENIFLCKGDADEIPKVLDFGLAKALELSGGVALTETGLVVGTPQYMAPEHLRGGEPSPDWDLWALAVVAFEMVTGELPFARASGVLPRFDDLRTTDLSSGLRLLFSRALAGNPLDRPTSAREFFDELDRALARHLLRPES